MDPAMGRGVVWGALTLGASGEGRVAVQSGNQKDYDGFLLEVLQSHHPDQEGAWSLEQLAEARSLLYRERLRADYTTLGDGGYYAAAITALLGHVYLGLGIGAISYCANERGKFEIARRMRVFEGLRASALLEGKNPVLAVKYAEEGMKLWEDFIKSGSSDEEAETRGKYYLEKLNRFALDCAQKFQEEETRAFQLGKGCMELYRTCIEEGKITEELAQTYVQSGIQVLHSIEAAALGKRRSPVWAFTCGRKAAMAYVWGRIEGLSHEQAQERAREEVSPLPIRRV